MCTLCMPTKPCLCQPACRHMAGCVQTLVQVTMYNSLNLPVTYANQLGVRMLREPREDV
jgi:hypothetical protein